jgi:hypothetical protein
MLGVATAVASIARIPGPLVAGFLADFAGLPVAFSVGSVVVLACFLFAFRLFRNHQNQNQ